MIEFQNVVKRYGTHFALDDVSFKIEAGEIVGLLGPNGAGKSTAMNILTGYLAATSGRILIDGIDAVGSPIDVRRKIGYLPEQPPLYPEMTVDEYLSFVYSLKGCTLNKKKHLEEIMRLTQITDVRSRLISHLSKGYRQRVGIAEALVGDPPILIFDEPTVGLDPKQIIEIRSLLRALSKKHTVLLSTHILSEVQAVCRRVIVINRGKIVANERTEDMTRTLDEERCFRAEIVGPSKEVLPFLRNKSGVKRVEMVSSSQESETNVYEIDAEKGVDVRKTIFFACADNRWPLVGLAPIGEDLESIFVRLINKSDKSATKADTRKNKSPKAE